MARGVGIVAEGTGITRPVVFRSLALADAREISDHLETRLPDLGDRFLARLEDVLERIEAMPELYAESHRQVRAAPLKKFRYVVYYVVGATSIEVIAVVHGARDPSAWQSRI